MIIKNDKPHLGDALMILAMMQQLQRENKDVAYNGSKQTNELLCNFVSISKHADIDCRLPYDCRLSIVDCRSTPLQNHTFFASEFSRVGFCNGVDVSDIHGDWNEYTKALNIDWDGSPANLGQQADGNYIGVCCKSKDFRRCYPHEKSLVKLLKKYGQVKVFGYEYLPYWKLIDEISSLKLLISTNNGIAHLAGCLGVPLVIIEGPYNCREIYGWYGDVRYVNSRINCRPCNDKDCFHANCLYLIHSEKIIQQAFELNEIIVDSYTDNPNRGYGDIIMSTVIAKAFKQKYPDIPVTYVVKEKAKSFVMNNPNIDKVVSDCPLVTNKTNYIKFNYEFENYSVLRNRRNRIDSMLIYSGISTSDKKPDLHFKKIGWNYKKHGKVNIGVGIGSAAPSRRWPQDYLQLLSRIMPACVFHIFDVPVDGYKNIVSHKLGFINLFNALSQMDKVVCVDSMISHIAGALDIPSVVLYTTIKASWRNNYYNSIGIQSPSACSPCMDRQDIKGDCNNNCCLTISPKMVANVL